MTILTIVVLILASIVSYNLLKIFFLSNLKINKWVVFGIFLIVLGLSLSITLPKALVYIVDWLQLVILMWFIDIFVEDRREKLKNKNKKVIQNRPKPKKSRMK